MQKNDIRKILRKRISISFLKINHFPSNLYFKSQLLFETVRNSITNYCTWEMPRRTEPAYSVKAERTKRKKQKNLKNVRD